MQNVMLTNLITDPSDFPHAAQNASSEEEGSEWRRSANSAQFSGDDSVGGEGKRGGRGGKTQEIRRGEIGGYTGWI